MSAISEKNNELLIIYTVRKIVNERRNLSLLKQLVLAKRCLRKQPIHAIVAEFERTYV